jgi:hypothetical protein
MEDSGDIGLGVFFIVLLIYIFSDIAVAHAVVV